MLFLPDCIGAIITKIWPGSLAEELGLEPGDKIIQINDTAIEDQIAFRFLQTDENLEIEVQKKNGETWILDVEKELDEDLGIQFEQATFDGIKSCRNKCIFCFIDQMPSLLRDTLYVKDDDYRHSFLFGNFITLTNLNSKELDRIVKLKLSPLYVSIHTTNSELRRKLLNNKNAGKIFDQLTYLTNHGISIHGQIVLVPGLNDGKELKRTIEDLTKLAPNILSLAVVPVGVTKFREGLTQIKPFTKAQASQVLSIIKEYQNKFLSAVGSRFVFAADEFYILAEQEIPEEDHYEDYPQLENGVGIVRLFMEEYEELFALLPKKVDDNRFKLLLTSDSAYKILGSLVKRLKDKYNNLDIQLEAVINDFFGPTVTVAGLLTGHDLLTTLKKFSLPQNTKIIFPDIMLKESYLFLDGLTVNDIREKTGYYIEPVETSAKGLIKAITGFTLGDGRFRR